MGMEIVAYHQVRMINIIGGYNRGGRAISHSRIHSSTDIGDHRGNGLVGKRLRYIKRNAFGNGKSVLGNV